MSKNKDGLMRFAQKGQEVINPNDAIKKPVILEFLGLPESHKLSESRLEEALITHLLLGSFCVLKKAMQWLNTLWVKKQTSIC